MYQNNLNLYKNLYLIRRTQEQISKNYHPEDKMRCPIHLCFGQEFMPSVLGLFLKKDDAIYSHHRSHGYFLAKGGSVKEMICEFYGKANGTNGGLAGSQELSCSKINFNSGTILSGAFAMAVGDAYAKKINKKNSITVTVIGDGGMEEGIVYESLNLAALKEVPVLFICENNLYSTHTRVTERVSKNNISSKVKQFGLRTLKLNNGNYHDHITKIKKEVDFVRKNKKPSFIEIDTYRLGPHVGPEDDDHFKFRPSIEKNKWQKKDPLIHYRKLLLKQNKNQKKIIELEKKINDKVNEAFKFAKSSKYPKLNSALSKNYSNTFSKVVKNFFDNQADFSTIQEKHLPKPY
tara:strand:+ start:3288 stop:4331 length:1044 start_codon:yes stop_codon:yes gene_type:complete